ncbi:MAG: hypothetical protein HYU69_12185 [Bacteroidetes bacterium]|nr:hypothetical protein [Bacteroidota bacterium]
MKRLVLRHKLICEMLDSCNAKLKRDTDNISVLRLRGILYNMAEKYEKALIDFKQLLITMPKDSSLYFLKSDCHFNMGEFDLAKKDFLRALQLGSQPDIPETAIENAIILNDQELKEIEEVLEHEKNKAILQQFPDAIENAS